jgi:hypothetical protein
MGGGIILVSRRRQNNRLPAYPLSEAERARLDAMLGGNGLENVPKKED